ncbi:MAG: peptidoglycan D,D-transpeptidase FtsI family protein [Alphaproteobacteria bacterium]
MNNSDEYIYENVSPNYKNIFSTKVHFKDSNDLLEAEKKKTLINHSLKVHKYIFSFVLLFMIIIVVNLYKVFFKNYENENIYTGSEIKNRGKIFDRNGELLATSIDTKDFYLNTRKILNKKKLENDLKEIFPNKSELYFEKILNKKQYIKIKKFLTTAEENELKKIGDPGIKFHKSIKRIYIHHNLFSHLTGFKSLDLKSKIEKNLDTELKKGLNVNLTLDLRVQDKVHEELSNSLKLYNAKSAVAIVMNANTGEIISLVSLPDFNPNHPEDIQAYSENNLAFEARYEMGSTLKIFNAALVYENSPSLTKNKFKINEGYQLTQDKLIEDKHIKKNILNFDEIFTKSSNVGSIQIIEKIGIKKQRELFQKINLGKEINLHGLKVVNNKLPANWDTVASKSISYGYGISISPVSLISAYAPLVNGGYKIEPKINFNKNIKKERILSEETSKKINTLLKKVVKLGTGNKARVNGIEVGGKTGTSKKLYKNDYSDKKLITSFIGAFPINDPRYLTLVLFDEPRRNTTESLESFGGNTAAPTFSRIVSKITPILDRNNYLKIK